MTVGVKSGYMIRWVNKADMQRVEEIERSSFGKAAWTADDYYPLLKRLSVVGAVLEDGAGHVAAVALYELLTRDKAIRVVRLIVDPAYRRRGLGSALLRKISDKLKRENRRCESIRFNVCERAVDLQLLLKHLGWRAKRLRCGHIQFELTLELIGDRIIERILAGDCRVMA